MAEHETSNTSLQGKKKSGGVPMLVGALLMGGLLLTMGSGTEEGHKDLGEASSTTGAIGALVQGEELQEVYVSHWSSLRSVLEFMEMGLKENPDSTEFHYHYLQGVGAMVLRTWEPSVALGDIIALHEEVLDFMVNAPLTLESKDILLSILLSYNVELIALLQGIEEEETMEEISLFMEDLQQLHHNYQRDFADLAEKMQEDMNAFG